MRSATAGVGETQRIMLAQNRLIESIPEVASVMGKMGRAETALDPAPLGMIEAGASTYAGAIPTILKVNSSNSLSTTKDQALTGSVSVDLGYPAAAVLQRTQSSEPSRRTKRFSTVRSDSPPARTRARYSSSRAWSSGCTILRKEWPSSSAAV